MVTKICKVCGKEFDARGNAKCCSPKCSKINKRNHSKEFFVNNPEYNKEYYLNNRDEILKRNKEYYENHRDEILEKHKEWLENNPEYTKEWYENHRDEILEYKKEYQKEYNQNKIAELDKKYDGDLELILKDCPNFWLVREAIMLVEYGVSYADAMYKKMEDSPVCEVTGATDNLVIHHLNSFNSHPELGTDPNNMVRITDDIHKEFHSIYGYGNNTREQWFEFLEKKHNLYI